jgi:hypothetical protein
MTPRRTPDGRKIVTRHVNPPIPDRSSDWSAHLEGEEEGSYGIGPTEEAAVADLLEKIEERNNV